MSELESLARVCILAMASLFYVYAVVSKLSAGSPRVLATLPIYFLFYKLPWLLSSVTLRGICVAYLVWFCSFRLILFCFDAGPLVRHQRCSVLHFLAFAVLPINAKLPESSRNPTSVIRSLRNLVIEFAIMILCFKAYDYREELIHQHVLPFVHAVNLLVVIDAAFACTAILAQLWLCVELEPQFNRPFLSTSIRDFWARRWNLVVTSMLRESIYMPVRSLCSAVIGKGPARAVGMAATFLVSGLMHEILMYYGTMKPPTWEWTSFFFLHGLLAAGEDCLDRRFRDGPFGRLPRVVKVVLTSTVMFATGVWLFFPPVIENQLDLKMRGDFYDAGRFLSYRLIGKTNLTTVIVRSLAMESK